MPCSHRWLWELSLTYALSSMAFLPVSALFPLMSMEYFEGDSTAAALVKTLSSTGMLTGSVFLDLWGGTRNEIITIMATVLGLGFILVLAGLLPPSGSRALAGLSLLTDLSIPFFNLVFMTLIQAKVESRYSGHVLGLTGAIMTLASSLGPGLTALFADTTGVPLWFLLAGAITLIHDGLMPLLPLVHTCDRP